MKMHKALWLGVLLVPGLLIGGCANVARSRDLGNPRVAARVTAQQVCSNCHGIDGVSVSPNFPRLAGQPREYLVAQLENFRSHHRADPGGYEYMWGITRRMSDESIAGLADYFSTQTPRRNAPVDAAQSALGRKVYEEGVPANATPPCVACHGPQGQGMANFPRLAYQHRDYLLKQLHVFQSTEGRPGTPMQQVTHQMSDREMTAVAAYLQAFPDKE